MTNDEYVEELLVEAHKNECGLRVMTRAESLMREGMDRTDAFVKEYTEIKKMEGWE